MVDVACIPSLLSLLNVLTVDEVVMAYKLLFTVLMFFVLAIPALAQTQPDIDHTPISATAIDADGSAWTVYSVAPGQITPNETVLVSFRSSDGKEHALRLRGGRLVLEGEADAMAKGMMKIFGEMLVAEMKRQGVKATSDPAPFRSYTRIQAPTRLAKRN
jgi:hypothetical protein